MLNKIRSLIMIQAAFILLIFMVLGIVIIHSIKENNIKYIPNDFAIIEEYDYVSHSFNGKFIVLDYVDLDEVHSRFVPPENLFIKYSETRYPYIQVLQNVKKDIIINILIPLEHVKPIK